MHTFDHTLSSSLPSKSGFQYEKETIHNSYRTGSFSSVKELPNVLKPGVVQLARREIGVSGYINSAFSTFRPPVAARDLFNKPHYICSDYDMEKVNQQWVRDEEKLKIDSNSRKPFKVTSRIRKKNEDIFYDPEYKFPHLGPGGGNISLDSITRSDVNDSSKYLYGQFYIKIAPSRNEVSQKAKLWATEIYKQLSKDWPQYPFTVKFSKRHEFLVMFEAPQQKDDFLIFPPPNNSLNRYMNQMAKHGLAFEYKLRRRGDRWNVLEREEPRDFDISDEGSNRESIGGMSNETQLKAQTLDATTWSRKDSIGSGSGIGNDDLLMGMNSDFNRSTYVVAERDDEDEDEEIKDTVPPRPLQDTPGDSRVNSAKVHLVYSFFAPWVNISTTQCLKTTAERNRKEAKEFAEKTKKDKLFLI